IIGGGAAGFFAAINIAEKCPRAQVIILEKSGKLLQKVKVSGGGRCNVTNGRQLPGDLVPFYPRGGKKLYRPLSQFGTREMRQWLSDRGIPTKVENDQRVFPVSDSSQTIIDCFLRRCEALNIRILTRQSVRGIGFDQEWKLHIGEEVHGFDQVVIATGASEQSWKWMEALGLQTADRVPSLFTFNIKDPRLQNLQGIAFPHSEAKVAGTKLAESGPLLITLLGISGPSIFKLSSVGAKDLADGSYDFQVVISWTGQTADEFRSWLLSATKAYPKKQVANVKVPNCPTRFWSNLLAVLSIGEQTPLAELSKKAINRLTEEMTQGLFHVKGKSTFKEEFVTCGGVVLTEVEMRTMQCKNYPGLYLAGEALNIDGLTGGFNFQSCWTAGWLISEHMRNQ
ncbi:MAG: aminoacetone oxidase family FAD-binding enzyme, partial [Bacteroidota bacterium]